MYVIIYTSFYRVESKKTSQTSKKQKVGRGGNKEEKSAKPTDAAEPVKFWTKISASSSRVRHGSGVASPPTAQWSPDLPSSHRSTPSQSHGYSLPFPFPALTPSASLHCCLPPLPPPPRLSDEEFEEGSRKSRKHCYQLEEERLRENSER